MKKIIKSLVLFSGGLDSTLSARLLQAQGIKPTALCFSSCFFDCAKAIESAGAISLPLITKNISADHLQMVKNPVFGYGKSANPCIDCHLLMLRQAVKIARAEGFDFIATGEVLGQRPFSQNKQALAEIDRLSGWSGYIVRPLSARLLEPTIAEKNNWLKREGLESIKGRGRFRQLKLAEKFGIKQFPQPAGGCILCEPVFGRKLFQLFDKWPSARVEDCLLLKQGRHFFLKDALIVIGRNKQENQTLEKLRQKEDILIVPANFSGPSALIRRPQTEATAKAKELIEKYTKKIPPNPRFKIMA